MCRRPISIPFTKAKELAATADGRPDGERGAPARGVRGERPSLEFSQRFPFSAAAIRSPANKMAFHTRQ
ncbi:hypothetical protein EVAR_93275_1 [Eumeta japonica]|uniref:Uncharacterized protein n=1 Tax=Eumeta variegata TaxID=151549 RepID=A0A4C1TXS2_EUMVA|nr:hypothetical protein EVAR_93275_1 [Eumeta japonica]